VDAGGGTIDFSAYRKYIKESGEEIYEEITIPQCRRYAYNGLSIAFANIRCRSLRWVHLCFDERQAVSFK